MTSFPRIKVAVAYTRVSTDVQGDTGIGLAAQRASIQAYAAAAGIEIVDWFQDVASARGKKNLERRPGLKNALAVAERLGASVIVDSYDRLSRHDKTIHEIIVGRRINVIPASEEQATDPAVLAARAARAEREGNLISTRTKQSLSMKKAAGVALGNRTNLPDAQKLGAEANKRRSESKVRQIADIIETNGWQSIPVRALVDRLNSLGITTGRNLPWTTAALRSPRKRALQLIENFGVEEELTEKSVYGPF